MSNHSPIPLLLNLPKALCDHLIGEHHTMVHRLVTGTLIMVVGVGVAQTAHELPTGADFMADLIGYLIHGIGATPYVEAIMLARKL